MKVVFVRPNYDSHVITPPLGLGYLSSYLKSHGVSTKIIDGLRDNADFKTLLRRILAERPDVVGITCLTAFYHEAVKLSRYLKKKKIFCVIGGVHPTFLPHQTLLDSGADYVICGEGEIAFLRLIENNLSNAGIKGVYSIKDFEGPPFKIEKAERVENLDELPFPDWTEINPNLYPRAPHGGLVKNFPIGIIMTTRGCPYECTFCASPRFYDRRIRFRTPENVVQEIAYLVDTFKVKEIHFEDDNLTLRREHITKICKLLIKRGIRVAWACPNGIRADKVDSKLLKLMKKAGCYYVAFGVESANPEILINIRKNETLYAIKKAIILANDCGILSQGFFIFGLPGENADTIEETSSFAKRVPLDRAQFLILDVLPGSELWYSLKGKFRPNWRKNSYKEPEWVPEGLTRKDLIVAQRKGYLNFYLRPTKLLKLVSSIRAGQIKFLFKRVLEYGHYT